MISDKETVLDVTMGASAASLEEVVITTTTRKETEAALLLDQKRATTIKQSIGAVELSKKGVGDAAGADPRHGPVCQPGHLPGDGRQLRCGNHCGRALWLRHGGHTHCGSQYGGGDQSLWPIATSIFAEPTS